ncbi:MAG: glycosyltransferase [Nanoarchaeota archaeon]|nr:glycosyltransferase [Nanoarchaeota archaeon]
MKLSAVIPVAPDRKLEILENADKFKDKIELIVVKGTNTSKNRNQGIKKAKTDFIAFLNAHTILPENWVEEVEKFFIENPEIDVVGGPQLTNKNEKTFIRASGYALSSIFGAADASTRYRLKRIKLNANEKHLTSANLICKKHVLKKIKFDEELYPGEDPKFISDAINAGFKVAYAPSIYVYHKRRTDFKSLTRQIFNYGLVRPRKEKFFDTLRKPIFLVPSIFVLYLALLPTLISINILLLTPLVLYGVLSLGFSIYELIKNKDPASIILLPLLFITIHLSYGVGFIYGSVKRKT